MTKQIHTNKPLLIYDGDCGFCQYWVDYWQQLTGDAVVYKPYQEVASQFPHISPAEFQKAIYYVAADGAISKAAKASLLTLSHAKGSNIALTLYRLLPGFAFIAEKSYATVAAHRPFFYRISLFLWGKKIIVPTYPVIAWLFLRFFSLIAMVAFVSFGIQALGLIGSQGILPIANLVAAAKQQLDIARYWQLPMLFWLNHSDLFIMLACWCGVLFSGLLFFNKWPRLCLLAIYALYLSLINAGQVFMTFQWDLFLVETALVSFFLLGSLPVGIWLLRWLLLRFMFAGGLVKLISGEPAWRDFTALVYYFNTEPLPTPLAWYAHHLSVWLLKTGGCLTLIVELLIPFLIFFPRRLRFTAAFLILIFQTIILITGNYNWFNLLTILLCLALLDDAAIKHIMPSCLFNFIAKRTTIHLPHKLIYKLAIAFAVITIPISLLQFHLRLGGNIPKPLAAVYNVIAPFSVVNMYGPFAVMTKVRMEIIIEGSNDGVEWREYTFKYKPGDVKRRPLWNIPLQPRLDWQMWFAALSAPQQNWWFFAFAQRLLENSPTVIALLETNPFSDKPPLYLRALFYEYNFTTSAERQENRAWWSRKLVGYYVKDLSLKSASN
jgi:predicted DCC family thiol-disulfide oxidoreductase YuxK